MNMDAPERFWTACALWLTIILVLECVRLAKLNRLPWWIIHGPLIAWGAVALVPWFIALMSGVWPVSGALTTVPLALPATYGLSLLALIGLAIGVTPFAVIGGRASEVPPVRARTKVVSRKAFVGVTILSAAYVLSLPSLSSLWKLSGTSGEDLYGNSDGSFLTLSLIILSVVAIGYVARQQPMSKIGIGLYLLLLLVIFGSALRFLILILILSYIIKRHPFRAIRSSLTQKFVFLLIGASAVWLVGFGGLGQLSLLRAGEEISTASARTQRTLSSLDVMGSAEFLLESGARPGQLHGSSYLALPDELIPRALLGSRSTPPAAEAEVNVLGSTGASAPLWIEGVLNFGVLGDLFSMIFVSGIWSYLLRRAISSPRPMGGAVATIGPVWVLFAYQALSRLLLIGDIDLFASIVIGLVIWEWIQKSEGKPQPRDVGASGRISFTGRATIRQTSQAMIRWPNA
jgi:hypothetical protein